jgi:hypothetical protein
MKITLGSLAFVALGIFLILVSLPGQLYVLTLFGAVCVLGGPVIGVCIGLLKAMPGGHPSGTNGYPSETRPTPQRPTRCGYGGRVRSFPAGSPPWTTTYQGYCDCGEWMGNVHAPQQWACQELYAHSYGSG